MSGKVFLDTNILIYAIESEGPSPQKFDAALMLARGRNVCLSTQVLGEFYRATTSARRPTPLTHEQAVAWVQLWKRHEIHSITVAHVDLALELKDRFQLQYFDALIFAAARFAQCETVYSEDLGHGQSYAGVKVINPFSSHSVSHSS